MDIQHIESEDLVTFINAGFACTRQREFYSDELEQAFSIKFLHEYMLGNYRRLYALTLAAGINLKAIVKRFIVKRLFTIYPTQLRRD